MLMAFFTLYLKVPPPAQFVPNSWFPLLPSSQWCLLPLVLIAFLYLWLPSSSLWCPHNRWGAFGRHQLWLQFTKTLVMPLGYQGHKRANWKQITHTQTCGPVYVCNHAHRRVNPYACHHTCTDTCTQYRTLNYSDAHINTHRQCVFQKAPQGEGKGVSLLFLMKSMWNTAQTGNEWGTEGREDRDNENPSPPLTWLSFLYKGKPHLCPHFV